MPISKRDYPIIQGVILVFSGAYVLVNLLVDLSYTFLDPRIRYCMATAVTDRMADGARRRDAPARTRLRRFVAAQPDHLLGGGVILAVIVLLALAGAARSPATRSRCTPVAPAARALGR